MAGLTVELTADVGVVSFTRPVLSRAVLADLDDLLAELECRETIAPVVIRSSHPTIFLAGADLAEIASLDARSSYGYGQRGRAVLGRLQQLPCATVAAVNGACSGGGFDLVLSCDRIAIGPLADFSHPGVHRGLVTGWGGTVALPAAAGTPRARLALITGTTVSGTALRGRVVSAPPGSDVVEAAIAVARSLARLHPTRIQQWRRVRNQTGRGGLARHRL